jgi:hypothetical protein
MTTADPPAIDVGRALNFIVDDPRARTKLLIGGLLLAVPIANIAAVGYQVTLARAVAAGETRTLPEWDSPGWLFAQGLGLAAARLIYAAPGTALWLGPVVAGVINLLRLATAAERGAPPPPVAWPAVLAGLGLVALGGLYGLGVALLAPAVTAHYARAGRFSACFNLRAIFGLIARTRGAYLRLWLAEWLDDLGVGLLLWGVGFVVSGLLCLGSLVTYLLAWLLAFVSMLVNGYLAGQLLRLDEQRV